MSLKIIQKHTNNAASEFWREFDERMLFPSHSHSNAIAIIPPHGIPRGDYDVVLKIIDFYLWITALQYCILLKQFISTGFQFSRSHLILFNRTYPEKSDIERLAAHAHTIKKIKAARVLLKYVDTSILHTNLLP